MDNLVIFCAQYLIFIVVLMVAVVGMQAKPKTRRQITLTIILAGVAALFFAKIASKLYYNPRPFVTENTTPLIAHGADNGFPSEHTTLAMTLTAVIYYYKRQWTLGALVLTILIGAGRVLANVHSPLDILGGLAMGTIAGWIGYNLSKKLYTQVASKPPLTNSTTKK